MFFNPVIPRVILVILIHVLVKIPNLVRLCSKIANPDLQKKEILDLEKLIWDPLSTASIVTSLVAVRSEGIGGEIATVVAHAFGFIPKMLKKK